MLNARQLALLDILLCGPARARAYLAEQLGVSERTLRRDLEAIRPWLQRRGVDLPVRQRGPVAVVAEPAQLEAVRADLATARPVRGLTPGERQHRLLRELLLSRGQLKLAYLSRRFGVAEATISNDLDRLEPWLRQRGLRLVRRQGAGTELVGAERNVRAAIVSIVRDGLTDEELYGLLRRMTGPEAMPRDPLVEHLLAFVSEETVMAVEAAVRQLQRQLDHRLADSAVTGLVVHLALAVERLRSGEVIALPPALLTQLRQSGEWTQASRLAAAVSEALAVALPDDEVGFITMHLQGARLRLGGFGAGGSVGAGSAASPSAGALPSAGAPSSAASRAAASFAAVSPDDAEALALAEAMASRAEALLGVPLSRSPGFITALAVHLVPTLHRLRHGLDIRNPLLARLREEYAELFSVSRDVCTLLAAQADTDVPEAEIGYVAMHLGAALEEMRMRMRAPHRIWVVCATGVGSSRLLASRLRSAVPGLQIEAVLSAGELGDELQRTGGPPDFIVSTVAVDLPAEAEHVPVVTIGPLLDDADLARVQAAATAARPAAATDPLVAVAEVRVDDPGVADADRTDSWVDAFRLGVLSGDGDWISQGVDLAITAGVVVSEAVTAADLRRREALGPTPVAPGLRLLHARTAGVKAPFVGLLRGDEQAALVLLAPQTATKADLAELGAVSAGCVEEPAFLQALRTGSAGEIRRWLRRLKGRVGYAR